MKIQILISKSSWAEKYKYQIISELKKINKNILYFNHHIKLKKNCDINIIFSYFKTISKKYLIRSKINLIPHESLLPKGRGMSPLTWQILKGKRKIFFSLIEADIKIDSGKIYYKKKVLIPEHSIFDEIKLIQLKENLKMIKKFIKYYKLKKTAPRGLNQIGKPTYYKKRTPANSRISINKNIKSQFNLLRTADSEKYPSFFIFKGKKYYLKIYK